MSPARLWRALLDEALDPRPIYRDPDPARTLVACLVGVLLLVIVLAVAVALGVHM